MISSIAFLLILGIAVYYFYKQVKTVSANIALGKKEMPVLNSSESWNRVLLIAFGQKKMFKITLPAILHLFVYIGFVIINIEVLEIMIDGIFGTHRALNSILGDLYKVMIATFEVLALLVLVSCVIFLIRRNITKVKRFTSPELRGFPSIDANTILIIEIVLMIAFLKMNAADSILMQYGNMPGGQEKMIANGLGKYINTGLYMEDFPISVWLTGMMPDNATALMMIERVCWWLHIIGIFAFLNYIPRSKHFHIIMAFPNVYFSKQEAVGKMKTIDTIKHEVASMLDPSYQAPAPSGEPGKFGANDVKELTTKNLMDAYSCTECGRCTSACPANLTGKMLSPRKIIMSVRDRMEDLGKGLQTDKTLLDNYITVEELWACTTCNACVEECPVTIDPVSTILEMRRFIVLEQSAAPSSINTMFNNIENNGAPWAFSSSDRMNWANDLYVVSKK